MNVCALHRTGMAQNRPPRADQRANTFIVPGEPDGSRDWSVNRQPVYSRAMGASADIIARHPVISVVVGLICLIAIVTVVGWIDYGHWLAECRSDGGQIATTPRSPTNPLIVETTDPIIQCLAADGERIRTR